MKNLKILSFFLILPVLLSAQGLDRPHAIISNFNITSNTYPTLTATGNVVSSDQYALINFRDSLASSDAEIHIVFDNTTTSPYSLNIYKVTSVTQTTGNSGTFVMEAILGTPNSFIIPNVASIQQISDEIMFELYDKGETFNTTINKHNHNWLTLDAALQNIEKDTLWKVECYTDVLGTKYNVFTNLDGSLLAVNDTDNTDIQTSIPVSWNLCPTLVVADSTWRVADSLYNRHVDNSMTVVSLNDLDSIWYSINKDTLFSRNNQGVLDTFQGGNNILWATEDGVNESPIIQKANIYYMNVANFPTWIGMPNRPVPIVINSNTGTITLAQADADSTVADMLIVNQIGDSLVLVKDGFVKVPNYNGTFGVDYVTSQTIAGFGATSIVSQDSCTQYIWQDMGGEWIDVHISPAVCGVESFEFSDSINAIKLLLVKDFNQVGNDHILTLENGTTFSVPDSIGIDSAGVRAILSDSLALYVAKSDSITLFVTLNQFNDSLVTKDVLLIDNMSIDSTFDITQGGNLVGTIDLSAYLKSNHVVSRYIDDVGNIVENDSIIFNTPSSLINFEFVENVLQLKLLNGTVTGQGWRYNTVGGWQIQNFEAGDITYTNTSDASITNVSAALDSLFNKTGGNPIVGVSRVELGAVDSIYFELLDGTRFSFTDTSVIQTLATALSTQVIGGHPIETDAETIILSIYDSLMNIQRDTLNKTLLQLALDGTLALNDGGADKIIQILSQDDGNMIAVGTDGGLYYKGSDLCIISVFAHETEGTNLIGNTSNFSPCVEREELYLEVPAVSTLQDTLYITLDTSFMTFPTRAYIKYVATGTIGSAVLKVSTNGAGFHDTSITGSTLESFIVLDSIGDWAMLEIYESQILTFKSSNAGSFTVEPQDIRYGVYPSNPDISYIVTGSDLHTITTAGITYGMPDGIPDTLGLLHTHPTQLFQTLKPSVTLTDCTDSTITVTEATAWAKANNVIVGSLIEFDCGWKGRFESDSTFSWLNKYAQIIPSQSCTETTPYYPFIGQFSGNNNTYTISELSFNGKIYDQGNGVGIVNNGGGSYDLSGPNQGFQLNQQISKDGDYVEFRMDQANNLIGIALTTNQSYNSFENNGNDAKYLLRGTTSSPSLNIIVDGISTGNTFENKVDGMKIRIEQVGKNIEFRQDGNLLYSEAIDEILVEKSICDLSVGIDENAAAIERIQDIATKLYRDSSYSLLRGFDSCFFEVIFENDIEISKDSVCYQKYYECTSFQYSPFDISTATLLRSESVADLVGGSQGITFEDEGTKMYIIGASGDWIYQYDLATPYNIAAKTFVRQTQIVTFDSTPQNLKFSPDGMKLFFTGVSSRRVFEHSLAAAWDISNLTLVNTYTTTTEDSEPQGLEFNATGTKMYIAGSQNDSIYQYDLGVAWSLSVVNYVNAFNVVTQDNVPQAVEFNNDYTKMYVAGSQNDNIYEYDLGAAEDISTATFLQSFNVVAQDNIPTSFAFNETGKKMFMIGFQRNTVHEYDLATVVKDTLTYIEGIIKNKEKIALIDVSEDGSTVTDADGDVLTVTQGSVTDVAVDGSYVVDAEGDTLTARNVSDIVTDGTTIGGDGTALNPATTLKHPTSFSISSTTGQIELILGDGNVLPLNLESVRHYNTEAQAQADPTLAIGAPYLLNKIAEGGMVDDDNLKVKH